MDSEEAAEETCTEHATTQDKAHLQHDVDAALGTQAETDLSLGQALKFYRKAVVWSVAMSMATIMESYDLILITSFYAFPQFLKKYGEQLPNGSYSIPSQWQVGLTLGPIVGLIPGVFASGFLIDRFGFRLTMFWSHVALCGFIFTPFFAPSIEVLLAGMTLLSVPCGVFAAATPGYAAEVCPLALRGYLTTYVNLCWVIGHLIAAGVLTSKLDDPSEWSYRIPFAIQWLWPPFLIVACWFAPESPWWFVKKGQREEAVKTLRRLVSAPVEHVDPHNTIAMMEHTIQTERDMDIRPGLLQRHELAPNGSCNDQLVQGCQILPGWAIQNFMTYFFTLAGLSAGNSFKLALGNYSIAFVGTIFSWFIQSRYGRRDIYLWGLIAMLGPMLCVGFLDLAPASPNIRWAQSALLLVWFFCYGTSIGPVPYAIAAEVGATQLRSKTISLGRNTYYFISILNTIVAPYMLNPTAGNMKGKAAFPAAGLTLMLIVWTYFRLPETKGMMPETLDRLFHARVPARKFKSEATKYQ